MNKTDPLPRDNRDLILEITACLESVKGLVMAASDQLDMRRLLKDFDGITAAFLARIQGENHPDRYLELAEEHFRRTRAGVQAMLDTSE